MADARKPLKIGLVLDDSLDKPDGVQQYVLGVGEWLRAQGHDVHYLVGETSRKDVANVHSLSRNLNVRFNRNRMSIPLPTSKRLLREFLRVQQFDILHVQLPHSPWLAHRLILAASPQTVVFGTFHIAAHGRIVTAGARLLGQWTRRSIKRFDEIVSVSPAAQALARSAFGVQAAVLPNVVDYKLFHTAQALSDYSDNKLTILFLGRLVPRKGCLILLQAAAQLAAVDSLPAFRVVICGKGPLEARLKAYVAARKLENIVAFAGFVSEADKPRYYASADIAAFPSTGGESFGIVLLEAMASGAAAVLAADNSGYRTVMAPRPELLFPTNNVPALAHTLEHFLTDASDRKAAATWGETYSQQFDVAVVGKKLEARYRALRNKPAR